MKKRMYIVLLTALLIVAFTACKEADTEKAGANTDMPLASIAPAPSYSGTVGSEDIIEYSTDVTVTISEAEIPEKATVSGGVYELPQNLEDFFAVMECALFGEVTNIQEYKLDVVKGDKTEENYFSGITFEVYKCYGGDEDLTGSTVQIRYRNCAHHDYGERYPKIEVGKTYFFFPYKTERKYIYYTPDTIEAYKELIERFPFTIPTTVESVAEEVDGGYNGAVFYALASGDYSPFEKSTRFVKVFKKEEIESIIEANTDKMRGLSPVEFFLEKQG